MAASTKFESSSSSPDGSINQNGIRGSYAASLERSGSLRESIENRLPSSLPGTSRSVSTSQVDMASLIQSLLTEWKLPAPDQKIPRQGELKKLLASLPGISPEDSSASAFSAKPLPASSVEELKRAKSNIHDNSIRARERAKYFGDAAAKIDKFHHFNIVPKKHSRTDISPNERPNGLLPGGNVTKNVPQAHPSSGGIDIGHRRSEERAKSAIPNRRIRTSVAEMRVDARTNVNVRPCGQMVRDKDTVKLVSGGSVTLSEEKAQALPPGDGWEKSKMKKKRSGMKSDVSESVILAKPPPGERETKRGIPQRLANDGQQRPNGSHGFRSSACEDSIVASHAASITKANASARAPRSSAASPSKASPNIHRAARDPDDSEVSQCTNKSNAVTGVNSRKRSASTQSPSPPVTQWVGQRLQKMSRVARRTNFSLVSGLDSTQYSETADTSKLNNEVVGHPKNLPTCSGQQIKLKKEYIYSSGLSEKDEVGVTENKLKNKVKKCGDLEVKGEQAVQRVSNLVCPSRRNKVPGDTGEGLGDDTKRQGRPGRGYTPSGVEKFGSTDPAKQLRSINLGSEKIESKPGRPPNKKSWERKGCTRSRHAMNNDLMEFVGGSDDDHEELLTAANHALNTRYVCYSSIWERFKTVFDFVSMEDIAYLKQQVDLGLSSLPSTPALACRSDTGGMSNGSNFNENKCIKGHAETKHVDEPYIDILVRASGAHYGISICQALLSAMIEEEETETFYYTSKEEECFSSSTYDIQYRIDADMKTKDWNLLPLENHQTSERAYSNGHGVHASWSYYDELDHHKLETDDLQYNQMCIEDRIFLELNDIGLHPEPVPDLAHSEDEGIDEDIKRLEEKLQGVAIPRRNLLLKLVKAVTEAKEVQDRELERMALEKLVGTAYDKYMAIWGPNAFGSKNTNKTTKHAAHSFVKRTLARCQKFEQTGRNCFNEPPFREMFLLSHRSNNGAACAYTTIDGDTCLTTQQGFKSNKHERHFSDTFLPENQSSKHTSGEEDTWSNKVKKRELLLNDVVGAPFASLRSSDLGGLASGTKGKRSERDRDGKGGNREASRNGTSRVGRPALSTVKGERKNKTKPKHRTTQLSTSITGLLDKSSDTIVLASPPKACDMVVDGNIQSDGLGLVSQDKANDTEAVDLSNFQLPEIDDLGVADDFDGQGQDFSSWLNFEDDGFQDQDIMGLEIPMDDLSDLNMLV